MEKGTHLFWQEVLVLVVTYAHKKKCLLSEFVLKRFPQYNWGYLTTKYSKKDGNCVDITVLAIQYMLLFHKHVTFCEHVLLNTFSQYLGHLHIDSTLGKMHRGCGS